jgi:hypothetical protein
MQTSVDDEESGVKVWTCVGWAKKYLRTPCNINAPYTRGAILLSLVVDSCGLSAPLRTSRSTQHTEYPVYPRARCLRTRVGSQVHQGLDRRVLRLWSSAGCAQRRGNETHSTEDRVEAWFEEMSPTLPVGQQPLKNPAVTR